MNIRAKCVNPQCKAKGIERSVFVGQLTGYGAKNDRVKCPLCGELMQTTKSVAVKPRGGTHDITPQATDAG
jgi:hypothetical protein